MHKSLQPGSGFREAHRWGNACLIATRKLKVSLDPASPNVGNSRESLYQLQPYVQQKESSEECSRGVHRFAFVTPQGISAA